VPRFAGAMACVSPSQHFPASGVERRDTSVKTRVRTPRELDVSHLAPSPFFRGIGRLKPLAQLERGAWGSNLLQRAWGMRIQGVLNPTKIFTMSVMLLKQLLHKCSRIDSRSPCSHFHRTKTRMWLQC
jgi:hypothetical protein